MHRSLAIIEVQLAIFREIHSEPKGKAVIAKLARTCRTFSNTALDVLWKELSSILYLIRCLPTDLWTLEHTRHGKRMSFQRAMSRSDWQVFSRYSSRVRSLTAFEPKSRVWPICHGDTELDGDVILALSHPPGYGSLVPCLQTLHWTKSHEEYAPLLYALFSDSLVELTLPYLILRSPTTSILMTSRCPSLKNLYVETENAQETRRRTQISSSLAQNLSEIILHLQSLESLECRILDKVAISHLSRLPSLLKLTMVLSEDLQPEELTPILIPPAFASLEYLTLETNTLSALTSFLEAMRFRPRSLSFTVKRDPTPDTLCLFFVALVNSSDSEQLSRISLTMESPPVRESRHGTGRHQVTFPTFQPLLTLPNVTSFTFDVMCNISWDDDAIEMLTSHWPKLTKLSLNASFGWGVKSGVTHRGLITLLSHCVTLTNFALAVDFTEVDQPSSRVPSSRPGNGVTSNCRSAYFVDSDIKYPVSIAAFLSDIFPKLDRLSSLSTTSTVPGLQQTEEDESRANKWDRVIGSLPILLAVRRQCMEWRESQRGEA